MKTIDATLLAHLALPVTTWCYLVKIECVGPFAGTVLGSTTLDRDVTYDDGAGSLVYGAENGFIPTLFQMTSGLAVDNTDMEGVTGDIVTPQAVRAGMFRSAKVTIYRVNYNDLTAGRHEVVAYGRAGEATFSRNGWKVQFRSLSQLLKQPISQPYSITCIAKFGSTGVRWACNKAITWESNGTVTGLGADTHRIFSDSGRAEADGYFSDHGGVIEWLTGDNTGHQMDVSTYASQSFDLALKMPYPIQIGDTYRPRIDCDFLFSTCRDVHANTDNFRGQNLMPVDGSAMVPGAKIRRAD